MSDDFLQTLSEAEQKALALCGITDPRQLANITPQVLAQDLQQARSIFPDDIPAGVLDEPRIAEICSAAAQATDSFPEAVEEESEMLAANRILPKVTVYGANPQKQDESFFVNHEPTDSSFIQDRQHSKEPITDLNTAQAERGKSMRFSTIRCGHPVIVYVGAFATILLIPAAFIVLALLWQVVTKGHSMTPENLGIGMAIVLGVLIFYFLMNGFARCTVCHINIFSLRNYPRNKYAFRIPLLGYSISTALRIFFTLKFTCPACGTKLKLSGHNSHHHKKQPHDLYASRHGHRSKR